HERGQLLLTLRRLGRKRPPRTYWNSRALLRAGVCGKPALPALLGRGVQTRWTKWLLGRPLQRGFAVGLVSDRERGLRARLPGYFPAAWGVAPSDKPQAAFSRSDGFSPPLSGANAHTIV